MDINHFFVAGINYRKTDTATRGGFAVGTEQYNAILARAKSKGITELFVVSTCNRTEIYGVAADVQILVEILCAETSGDPAVFLASGYIRQGNEAIAHIFSVAAGLDSQILGDYEIIGQLKTAVNFSREKGCIGAFSERLFNTVLQSSKAIKNNTHLSGGTISVSFAAIRFLRENMQKVNGKKILLLGTGKIGQNTCRNLVDYLETKDITLINRTSGKATILAEELGLKTAPVSMIDAEIAKADIIIVATNAPSPVITQQNVPDNSTKILVDLSVPNNIEPSLAVRKNITLANVDDLSRLNDETLSRRRAEVPKAKKIIQTHITEFFEWFAKRRNVPVLRAVKQKLYDMDPVNNDMIQKVLNNVAVKMQQMHQPGCHYIEAINDFMKNSAT